MRTPCCMYIQGPRTRRATPPPPSVHPAALSGERIRNGKYDVEGVGQALNAYQVGTFFSSSWSENIIAPLITAPVSVRPLYLWCMTQEVQFTRPVVIDCHEHRCSGTLNGRSIRFQHPPEYMKNVRCPLCRRYSSAFEIVTKKQAPRDRLQELRGG